MSSDDAMRLAEFDVTVRLPPHERPCIYAGGRSDQHLCSQRGGHEAEKEQSSQSLASEPPFDPFQLIYVASILSYPTA